MKQRFEETDSASLIEYLFSPKAFWFFGIMTFAIVTAISFFVIPQAAYPLTYLRNLFGIIFLLFLPGYALIKALFLSASPLKTNSEKLDHIERIALSMALSLVLVPTVGLILNFTSWGIRLIPLTLSLLALTIILASIAILREYREASQAIKIREKI
jgi:uncharacterized membrane protein